ARSVNDTPDAFRDFLLEVTFGNEFGISYNRVRKWDGDIAIYLPVTAYPELNKELDRIIDELNNLSEKITLDRVDSRSESNFIVFFGNSDTYVSDYEPNAAGRTEANYGLFWTHWDGRYRINEGSLYVDMFRVEDPERRKHLLREELTQAPGLMNDTDRYPESIFYGSWTCTTSYSEMDRQVIKFFLSSGDKAGMGR
ncbi:MAG: DUF2927 domain-containing protein, partial [Balneolaceae bacterium]|nr:DUF2927 domain-containing protein [Balneolaceae bacterium]